MTTRLAAVLALLLGCAESPGPVSPEAPPEESAPVAVTKWTARTELFMEYAPLEVGRNSRFAIHLTDLDSFQPLTEGRVAVTLDYGGEFEEFVSTGPSQPGIFGVDVSPSRPGKPSMTVAVRSATVEDRHCLGPAAVWAPGQGKAEPSAADDAAGAVTYLKEQQWTLDFATGVVASEPIRSSVVVPAVVEALPGSRTLLRSPVGGRLLAPSALPQPGERVAEGDELGRIAPLPEVGENRHVLELASERAVLALRTALRERQRAERLVAAGAVPARRLDEARDREALARTEVDAAKAQMDHYEAGRQGTPHLPSASAHVLRSHVAGVVTSVFTKSGARVEAWEPLLEIAHTGTVLVSGAVPEASSGVLRTLRGAELELAETGETIALGNAARVGHVVNPASRTLGVTYRVPNRQGRLALGRAVSLRLFTSAPARLPAVPVAAVVDEDGLVLVYVQTAGETFQARTVTLGSRRGASVHVLSGLSQGDRVVTRGAYAVHLSSMSTEPPAHGHAH